MLERPQPYYPESRGAVFVGGWFWHGGPQRCGVFGKHAELSNAKIRCNQRCRIGNLAEIEDGLTAFQPFNCELAGHESEAARENAQAIEAGRSERR